jgi:uncharacterized protein involved in outer membrane biogenesis
MKKIAIALGLLIFLVLAAAVALPFLIDVDKYRPQITEAVNRRINGRLELGRLQLSLWGQLKVQIGGVNLTDPQGRKVVAVSDAFFHMPFSSLLAGAPELALKMNRPEILVVKNKDGKLNVMSLLKTQAEGEPVPPADQGSREIVLPGLAARARLGIEVRDALLTYLDEATGLDSKTRDLTLVVRDLSLSRPTAFELSASLDTRMGKSMVIKGPARLKGTAQPTVTAGKLEQVAATVALDLDDLDIVMPGLFEKHRGIPANASGTFRTTQRTAAIENFKARFHNADLTASGTIDQIDTIPQAALKIKAAPIDLKPWGQILPMLRAYELAGTATFDADAEGGAEKLGYHANLAVQGLTAKAPNLKTQPTFDAAVNVATDQIEKFTLTMKAPGNDLRVAGKLVSFARPQIQAQVESTGMDLDQLLVLPEKGKTAAPRAVASPATGEATAGKAETAAAPASDHDALLAPLRESAIARAATAIIEANLRYVQMHGVRASDVRSRITMKELVASIDPATFGIFGGAVRLTATSDFKPRAPTYRFSVDVQKLSLQQAVSSQFRLFENTLLGTAFLKMDGSGASFNPETAKANLNAKGSLRVENATFASIDVSKMATEAINQAIDRIGEKLPAIKGKKLHAGVDRQSKYSLVTSDFTIVGGKFSSPNFVAKAEPNSGIDLNGNTTAGLIDYSLSAKWMVIDTYNVLKAKDLAVEQSGVRVDHVLAESGGPVKFPVSVGCKAVSPCYDYAEVPEYLAKVALNNAGKAAQGRIKEEARKQVERKAKEILPGLGKKLFGR